MGIYDSGFEEFDETYVFVDIRHIQLMNRWEENQIGNFEVFIDDFDQLEEKSNEIYGKTVSVLDTQNIKNKYFRIFEWIFLISISL